MNPIASSMRNFIVIALNVVFALGTNGTIHASTLSGAEYSIDATSPWCDNGPAPGSATTLPPADGVWDAAIETVNVAGINPSPLTTGTNAVCVRFKDSTGQWGNNRAANFTFTTGLELTATLSGAEYFIDATSPWCDNGPAPGSATTLPPADGVWDAAIETVNVAGINPGPLTTGTHAVCVRFKDSTGQWGTTRAAIFTTGLELIATLSGAEYFIDATSPWCDNGPAPGSATTLPPADGVWDAAVETVNVAGINPSPLTTGTNAVCVRFKDSTGQWGNTRAANFTFTTGSGIAACEYYIDTDPGVGKGQNLPAKEGAVNTFEQTGISATNLTIGTHTVGARCRDELGQWGIVKTATFVVNTSQYTLNINKMGTGKGTVISNPTGINCGNDCSENFASNSTVALTATADAGNNFASWGGACSGTASTCNITMNANKEVTANFTIKTYTVTPTAGTGGMVSPNTPQTVNHGATKAFTVTANTGYNINSTVTGDCPQGTWNGNVWTTGAITANCTLGFSFTSLKNYTLSLNKTGTGTGTITSTPTGINCGTDCAKPFTHGTTITLTAAAATDSTFGGWNGANCTGIDTCTLTITADDTITANFETTLPTTCGKTWTPQTSGTSNAILGIIWNGSQFVAVAEAGVVLTSPDGTTWTVRNIGYPQRLNAIAWSGAKLVAVADDGINAFAYLSNDAITWQQNTITDSPILNNVVWHGDLNKLLAVGTQGTIRTSPPEATPWTATTPETAAYVLNAITTTGTQYVAVGSGSTVLTSTDANTWTAQTGVAGTSLNLSTVVWNGYQFLTAGSNTILASTNGTTWSQLTTTGLPSGLSLYHIIWNGSRYIGAGSTGIFTSINGRTWQQVATSTAALRNLVWNGSQLIAVGNNGSILRSDCMQTQTAAAVEVSYDPVPTQDAKLIVNALVNPVNSNAAPTGDVDFYVNGTRKSTYYEVEPNNGATYAGTLTNGNKVEAIYLGDDSFKPIQDYVEIGTSTSPLLKTTENLSHALTVTITGSGKVKTPLAPWHIDCSGDCKQNYPKHRIASVTLRAIPDAGKSFSGWSGGCSGTADTCTVTMNADQNVTATFAQGGVAKVPSVSTDPPSNVTTTSATLKGWINDNGAATTATFDFGTTTSYGTNLPATPGTITANTGATAVTASRTGLTCGTTYYYRTKAVNSIGTTYGLERSFTTTTCSGGASYTITPTIGKGGTLNPNTVQTVTAGTTRAFTVTPNTGYSKNTTVGGTCPQGSWNGNVWTTGPINSNCTVAFSCLCQQCLPSMGGWRSALALISRLPNTRRARATAIHKITPSAGTGGTIIPNTMRLVLTGTKAKFTITPSTGKKATVTGTCGGTPTTGTTAFTYTTNPVRQNCTIQVSFAATLNKAALDTTVDTADTKATANLPAWQDDHTVYNAHPMGGTNGIADLNTPQVLPTSGSSAFDFTKLDANGQDLPVDADDYTCLRDNASGLIWESKTQDGVLQDQNWSYTWYDSSNPGGNAGTSSGGICYTVGRCDSEKYTHDINARGLCGGKDWRLPTIAELATIANSPLTQYQPPTWAAFDPSLVDGYNAMVVNFATGHIDPLPRSVGNAVLLVR